MWFVWNIRALHATTLFALLCNAIGSRSKQMSSPLPVAGWGESRYVYEPSLLPLPPQAKIEHAHGIVVDETDKNAIIITYKDEADPSRCLLRWRNISEVAELIGPREGNDALCRGVPHGLITTVEEIVQKTHSDSKSSRSRSSVGVLYHANNEQALHKTTTNGDIIWTVNGKLEEQAARHENSTNQNRDISIRNENENENDENDGSYSSTWFASQPESPYIFLADGYGSSKIYVLNKFHGKYTGHSFGGYGTEHGKFQTCHSISQDQRLGKNEMVVCDRENHRLEYFRVDPHDPSVFDYVRTVSFDPLLRRPCNLRFRPEDGRAIVPFLEGSVGILDHNNALIDVINITATLGQQGFLHPHDAHFVPGTPGDFVVVTWNPGRIGYFRKIVALSEESKEESALESFE